jgi:hypothetical protein
MMWGIVTPKQFDNKIKVFILHKSIFLVQYNLKKKTFLIHHLKNRKVTLYSETRHTGHLCCVCYELQLYSGGEQRQPVHCVHPKHWKPVLGTGR